mmetsp:Transcript_3716/g.8008  ORF Transcript_3716/g.8008 Transcript_3716/m.8008 type:complete len:551 (-) Transcript_3716:90-1742(-)
MAASPPPAPPTPAAGARRSRSTGHALRKRDRTTAKTGALREERPWLDPPEVKAPRGGRRWLPGRVPPLSAVVRREVRALLNRRCPDANDFSGWQMPFPFELESGANCPICTLGECGTEDCPTYRPKHPEVREAIEKLVVEKCMDLLVEPPANLDTYVSIGSGLLAQDWIILEKLQAAAAELRPCRVIFVELRTAKTVAACEGRNFDGSQSLDLCQMGFPGRFGPEFSFSAVITFSETCPHGCRIFDFCNGPAKDNIFVEVERGQEESQEPGGHLIIGVRRGADEKRIVMENCWAPGVPHAYLFTVSATGMYRIYIDEELWAEGEGHPPRPIERRKLLVGESSEAPDLFFQGSMRKIAAWEHCVDSASIDNLFAGEIERALHQFSQWYAEDFSVWTFGSLASYVQAVAQDPRFAADLLLRVDVHDNIDGYDDFVRKVLSPHGLALTLGGPGRSWHRRGSTVEEISAQCEVLEAAEARARMPWVTFGPWKAFEPRYAGEVQRPLARWPVARPARVATADGHQSHRRRRRDASPGLRRRLREGCRERGRVRDL